MGKSGQTKKNIGIMGGTFNPIHIGHLSLAEAARDNLHLDLVVFIPARIPPHKNRSGIVDFELRYEMVKRAINGNAHFKISRIEIDKPGLSYSVETLRILKRRYLKANFFFLIGSDSALELKTWKNIEEIFSLCRFVVAKRPGFNKFGLPRNALFLKGVFPDVSSSLIRKMLSQGKSIRYLVPDAVNQFIKKRKIYS